MMNYKLIKLNSKLDLADSSKVTTSSSRNTSGIKARESLNSGTKQRVLVDTCGIKSSIANAWRIYEAPSNDENTKVIAFLSKRPIERHLLSFYFSEDPSASYQTRLFTNQAKAEEWLQLFARINL